QEVYSRRQESPQSPMRRQLPAQKRRHGFRAPSDAHPHRTRNALIEPIGEHLLDVIVVFWLKDYKRTCRNGHSSTSTFFVQTLQELGEATSSAARTANTMTRLMQSAI